MMRVLILTNSASGLWSFRREVLERFLQENYTVTVDTPDSGKANRYLQSFGVKLIPNHILACHSMNPLMELRLLLYYYRILREDTPDIMLSYTIKPNVYGGIACQLARVPYIANVTGLGTAIQNGGALQVLTLALYRLGLLGAQRVFFQNAANRDFMLSHGVISGPYALLPGSGVSTERFTPFPYPSEDDGIVFLMAGRIMRDKGTLELIEAACEVKPRHPEIHFVFVGSFDGGLEEIVRYAESQGIIEYVPPQVDVRPYYAKCHALVHPSWHEGMSNVCLEAAACARPIIASDVPGCRETFDEGVSGIGFEPRNARSLVEALERFLALPWEERRDMGLAGRAKVEREFDRQIVVDRYMEEIRRAVKQ